MAGATVHVSQSVIIGLGLSILNPMLGAGCVAGAFLTPDLDHSEVVTPGAGGLLPRPLKTWWRYLWYPYGKLMVHRGLSHWPLVGTLTRLVYFFPLTVVLLQFDGWWLFLLGLVVSDLIHWCTDGMYKRWVRRSMVSGGSYLMYTITKASWLIGNIGAGYPKDRGR
jgi:uncharacterized metal-binding protein